MLLRKAITALLLACALAACAAPKVTQPPVTGTWVGPLPVSATEQRTFAVVLHERGGLKLMGYLLGGTSRRVLAGALRSGDHVLLVFDMKDAGIASQIVVSGEVAGDTMTGAAYLGSASYPVVWTRRSDPLEVRTFAFLDPTSGSGDPHEFAIVQDETGALVTSNFTGSSCSPLACGGAITSFAETAAGALTIAITSDGACHGAGAINATFNATTLLYSGTWTHTDAGGCGGAITGGTLMGGRDLGTRSTHAANVLAGLGQLADDLESGVTFSAPYGPVSASYLHFGQDAGDFLAERNAEVASHPGRRVEFYNISAMRTVVPAGHTPLLGSSLVVLFSDRRTDAAGEYRSVAAGAPGQTAYAFITEEAGVWRLSGNHMGEFDLPFAYTPGVERLIVPTDVAGQPLSLSLGGWGAHFAPLTGHLEGNAKADMMAQFAGAAADLVELANGTGGAPGACDVNLVASGAGEICGVYGGPTGDLIRSRILRYRAPYDGTVTEIAYEERPRPPGAPETHYFDNVPHWSVRITFGGGLSIHFDHLGQLTGAVRAGLIAAKGINPDTYTPSSTPGAPDYCPPAPLRCHVNVLDGASFPISAHEEIARAQTDAAPIAGHPGYYRGQLGPSIPPWSQVEFFVEEQIGARTAETCIYQYLPPAKQTTFASLMTADMLNPQSLRYADNAFITPWAFRAEAALCNNDGYLFRDETDFSAIQSQLGGWFERSAPGTTPNEQFSVATIHPNAGAYNPALYDFLLGSSDHTQYLVGRERTDGAAFTWSVSGGGSVSTFYPIGEVLELTPSSFVVKWREIGASSATFYQRAAYILDSSGLKIAWGPLSPTLAAATVPTLAPGAPCNDTTTLCYAHARP